MRAAGRGVHDREGAVRPTHRHRFAACAGTL